MSDDILEQLLITEVVTNIETTGYKNEQMVADILESFNSLKLSSSNNKQSPKLLSGPETLAVMLYTYEKIYFYRDLKTTMLGKKTTF